MRFLIFFGIVFSMIFLSSCRNDFDFEPSMGTLEFSRDTVYLDTVFTNIGSSTYTLKVYNRSSKNITIPKIQLAQGEQSNYRLMVDGISGKIFNNVELLAKDSLFVFIETTIDYDQYANSDTSYLYTDQIVFDQGARRQEVELVTLVQDAVFLYPNRHQNGTYESITIDGLSEPIYGFILDANDPINGNELVWTSEKPYVIYGYAAVPSGATLEIQEGARIHFHDNSGLIVGNNGTLQALGSLSSPIIIEGDRLEPSFADVPGQWGRIWLTSGSINNKIEHTTIKNASIGLMVDNSPLELKNTQIYNCSYYGLVSQTGSINGFNVVINNVGLSAMACLIGGNYNFSHSTLANYWSGYRQHATLVLDNTYQTNTGYIPLTAHFENCIVFGRNNIELTLNKADNSSFDYNFTNCFIKFIDLSNVFTNNSLYNFSSNELFNNCLIAQNLTTYKPEFANPTKNDLRIRTSSSATGAASSNFSSTTDILGNPRTGASQDIGAYNHADIPE